MPYLEYRSASLSGTITNTGDTVPVLDLTFYFQDGDGDIGSHDNEPSLYFALQEKSPTAFTSRSMPSTIRAAGSPSNTNTCSPPSRP